MNIQQATGEIKGYTVELHVLPAGVRAAAYCKEKGIDAMSEDVFINRIGDGEEYSDIEDWKFSNEMPFAILKNAGVDASNAKVIIQVQRKG